MQSEDFFQSEDLFAGPVQHRCVCRVGAVLRFRLELGKGQTLGVMVRSCGRYNVVQRSSQMQKYKDECACMCGRGGGRITENRFEFCGKV